MSKRRANGEGNLRKAFGRALRGPVHRISIDPVTKKERYTMDPNKLYQLAFALQKANLWKSLYESELFEVTLLGDEVGYCCVAGAVR